MIIDKQPGHQIIPLMTTHDIHRHWTTSWASLWKLGDIKRTTIHSVEKPIKSTNNRCHRINHLILILVATKSVSWHSKPSPSLASSFLLLSNTAKGRWPSDVKYSCTDSRAGTIWTSQSWGNVPKPPSSTAPTWQSKWSTKPAFSFRACPHDEDGHYRQQMFQLYLVGGEGSRVKRVTDCERINTIIILINPR